MEICMNDDYNTMLYVIVHEISHIICPEYGHTELFDKINYKILYHAMKSKIYTYEDYTVNQRHFGDIHITYNILGKRPKLNNQWLKKKYTIYGNEKNILKWLVKKITFQRNININF